MTRATKTATGNQFMRHNAVFWGASLGVAALNYLFYPVLSHFLKPGNFGEVQTIMSSLTQLAVFFQVLGLVNVGVIARYSDKAEQRRVSDELARLAFLIGGGLLVLTIIASPWLAQFFRFGSPAPFLLMAVALFTSMLLSFANAYLQGHKRFAALSASMLTVAVGKILLAVAFVLAGGATLGAIGGFICAQLVALGYALKAGSGVKSFVHNNLRLRRPNINLIHHELGYGGIVLVSAAAANLLLSLDILVVKHYFPPTLAGHYAGVSVIANAIFFVSSPFASVLLPSLKPDAPGSANLRLLKRSLLLTASVGGLALLVFLAMPHLVVTIMLGHAYAVYSGYLRGLGLALFVMSLANILVYYHLGLRNYAVALLTTVGVAATLAIIAVHHADLSAIVTDLIAGSLVTLALLIGLTLRYHTRPAVRA